MFRLFLFDIDGTLISTDGAGVKAFAQVCNEVFGLPGATAHFTFAGRTDLALVREIFERNDVEPTRENIAKFQKAYLERLPKWMPAESQAPLPGVHQWLKELPDIFPEMALGLLTGNLRSGAEIKLSHYGLWNQFQFGAFGGETIDRNEVARQALSEGRELIRGLQPEEVLVIGDTQRDVECARSIGAKVLAVATGPMSVAELTALKPDWVAEDLTHFLPRDLFQQQ